MNVIHLSVGSVADHLVASFNSYFEYVSKHISAGQDVVWPTALLYGQAGDRLVVELAGASSKWSGIHSKRIKPRSAAEHFGGFANSHTVTIGTFNSFFMIAGVCIANTPDLDFLRARLPSFDTTERTIITSPSESPTGGPVNCINFDDLDRPLFVSATFCHLHNEVAKIRSTNIATIIPLPCTEASLAEYWSHLVTSIPREMHPIGLQLKQPESSAAFAAARILSNVLTEGVSETTLSSFLSEENFLLVALGGERVWFQPRLEWQAAGPPNDLWVQPDFIMQHADGRLTIGDFKLPLHARSSVTKGKARRREFISPISEGIAQLAHYESYFGSFENRESALTKYGIDSSKAIDLLLIAGTWENSRAMESREASRPLKANLRVLDYDSVLQLFLLNQDLA